MLIWDDLGFVCYLLNRKCICKCVFIGLKICVVILKNFILFYFVLLILIFVKNMSWFYKYDYNVIFKCVWKFNMLIGFYRRKVLKVYGY